MKALCCGSFDPITKGHEDIVRRAARLFDEVVVLIARNPDKTGFFSEEVRRGFCEKTFADLPNVTVDVWDGIVVDYARKVGWFYGDGTYPSYDDFINMTYRLLDAHPNLNVMLAHMFFKSFQPDEVEALLQKYPHVTIDLAPGWGMMDGAPRKIHFR